MRSISSLHLITILFITTFALYLNTLGAGLFFDDQQFIYENAAVTSFDIKGIFSRSLVDGDGRLSNYYRPILFLSYALEYNLFGNSGFIYHLGSMMLHAGCGIVFFLVLHKLCRNKTISFFAALLFIIHPVQTEAIAYASGRGDPLSLFFVLITILLSLEKRRGTRAISIASLILALLSKETALITPGLIFISQMMLRKSLSLKSLKESLIETLPYAVITGVYFSLRLTVLNFANTLNFYRQQNIYTSSIFIRINEFFNLVPQYASLIFFPKDLFMERDLVISLAKGPTLSSVLSFVGSLAATILSIKTFKKHPLVLFGLMWTIISFVPSSGIIPINGIFYEHFLYYPSLGIFTVFTYIFYTLFKKAPRLGKGLLVFIFAAYIGILSLRTTVRNSDWKDPITFYSRTNEYVHSARIYNNLAMAYAQEDLTAQAIDAYKKALAISDVYPQTHYNLANTYLRGEAIDLAIKEYKRAIEIDPYFYLSYVRLYEIYRSQNKTKDLALLEDSLRKVGEINPQFRTLLDQLRKSR